MRAIIVAALLLGVVDASHAQVNCQKIGEQTYCSNGQVMQRFGNTVYDGKGHAWQESGNRTTSADGTIYRQSRNQISSSKGDVVQQFGSQNFNGYQNLSNGAINAQRLFNQRMGGGSLCHPIGNEIFCDPAPATKQQQAANRRLLHFAGKGQIGPGNPRGGGFVRRRRKCLHFVFGLHAQV